MARVPHQSSVLAATEYIPNLQTLDVVFTSGDVYRYSKVPLSLYRDLLEADSKGTFFKCPHPESVPLSTPRQLKRADRCTCCLKTKCHWAKGLRRYSPALMYDQPASCFRTSSATPESTGEAKGKRSSVVTFRSRIEFRQTVSTTPLATAFFMRSS